MVTAAKKLLIGAHTSIAGGLHNALIQGQSIGATTIQIFTANQRQWKAKPLTKEAIDVWHQTMLETGLQKVMSHDSYLINLGSPDQDILIKSRETFRAEVERCIQLKLAFLNFHPGTAKCDNPQQCLDCICDSLLDLEPLFENTELRLLLEATAGQGSVVGAKFEELSYIIEKVQKRIPIGVCIDTCHIFAAGYDLRTWASCDQTIKEFDRVVGLNNLYAFHLNDSKKGLGTRVDRHEHLGKGEIGLECFKFLMQDPRTRDIPKFLETPLGPSMWQEEITLLRNFAAEIE